MYDPTNVIERPKSQRCWVVRASGGDYVSHFRKEGVMALGHIDALELPENDKDDGFVPDYESLKVKLESQEKISERGAFVHFRQVKSFISEINIGDLVVTVDRGLLMVGRVIGYSYIDNKPVRIIYDEKRNQYTEMPFRLRRKVQWGPVLKRSTLPSAMLRSITSRLTVFNIDQYWSSIYHLLYPVFQYENCLYFSARIQQRDEINNFNVSQVFRILTELEVVVTNFEQILDNPEFDFDNLFAAFKNVGEFRLKTTAEFMSPGSIWSHLGFSDKDGRRIIIGALLYGAVFGVDIANVIKVDGLIHKEARAALIEYFLQRLDENDVEQMRERLKLEMPNFNTSPLEDNSNDAGYDERYIAASRKYENRKIKS
ncbi:MAG: hypothetical protein HUJ29_13195 [Gammaproteobacteria bacterium]|nr:hypothetical protein [Gammaproteobacteria bacterium]